MKNTATKAQAADAPEEPDDTDVETDSEVPDVVVQKQKDEIENREDDNEMDRAQWSPRNTTRDPKRKRPAVESPVNSPPNKVLIYNKITYK